MAASGIAVRPGTSGTEGNSCGHVGMVTSLRLRYTGGADCPSGLPTLLPVAGDNKCPWKARCRKACGVFTRL